MKKSFLIGLAVFGLWFSTNAPAQMKPQTEIPNTKSTKPQTGGAKTAAIKVVQIDTAGLKNLLKPNSKPLLINFWATWCDPCREEFPDLVKLEAEYRGRVDVVTVSLDYLSEIERDVPKFLLEMKAEMPAFLLKTDNEDEAIKTVSAKWEGALPFTILLDTTGKESYSRQGKFKPEVLRTEIDKLLTPKSPQN